MNINEESQPWCEKYRPTQFENIVLDPYNKDIFLNMLDKKYFPNILLYGPPGTVMCVSACFHRASPVLNQWDKSQ